MEEDSDYEGDISYTDLHFCHKVIGRMQDAATVQFGLPHVQSVQCSHIQDGYRLLGFRFRGAWPI